MVVAAGVGLLSANRTVPRFVCAGLAGLWLFTAGADHLAPSRLEQDWRVPAMVEALGVERAAIQLGRVWDVPVWYQYFLPDVAMRPWTGRQHRGTSFVFGPLGSRTLPKAGARVALLDETRGFRAQALALWVLPGDEQERLAREGRLLPEGFPKKIPEGARRTALSLSESERRLQVRAGERLELVVEGQHRGTGSPWPDVRSFGRPGRVQLRGRPLTGGRHGPATVAAELPSWVDPGGSFRTRLVVSAVDSEGQPLARGSYRFGIDMYQVGYGWFAPRGQERLKITVQVD
jgi:hypothetical protein